MPVIRRIRLNILSKDDIRELENNIVQLESLAKRKEVATRKVNEVRSRKGKTVGGPSGTIFKGTQGVEGSLPGAITKKMSKAELDRLTDAVVSNQNKSKDKSSAAPFRRGNELVDKVNSMEDKLDKTIKDVTEVEKIVGDPVAFITNLAGSKSGIINKLFKITIIITILQALILKIAKKMFGPGGILDIRKLFKDEAASINQLALLIDISQGKTFYSSDLRTFSHIVANSSTETLGKNDQLYKEINIGSDII